MLILIAKYSQVRVVSMPCWELFEAQDDAYKASVLPADVSARVAVEAGCSMGWSQYIGLKGEFVGHSDFGASAPGPTLYEKFGITVDGIVAAAKKSIAS